MAFNIESICIVYIYDFLSGSLKDLFGGLDLDGLFFRKVWICVISGSNVFVGKRVMNGFLGLYAFWKLRREWLFRVGLERLLWR